MNKPGRPMSSNGFGSFQRLPGTGTGGYGDRNDSGLRVKSAEGRASQSPTHNEGRRHSASPTSSLRIKSQNRDLPGEMGERNL